MYHSNFYTKRIFINIFKQLKHIRSKALVAQWVHHFTLSGFALYKISLQHVSTSWCSHPPRKPSVCWSVL